MRFERKIKHIQKLYKKSFGKKSVILEDLEENGRIVLRSRFKKMGRENGRGFVTGLGLDQMMGLWCRQC